MQNVFFTSDHHFGHRNVIEFCKRPFGDVDEMTEAMIDRHNEVVRPGDLVYILGDMFWRSVRKESANAILWRMNGQKYYIWGNHEETMRDIQNDPQMREHFVWYRDIANIHPADTPHIILCHYAMRTWEGSHKGAWQLYGHSHNGLSKSVAGVTLEESPLSMDVGVDTHNFYPWHLDEVAQEIKTKNEQWQRPRL